MSVSTRLAPCIALLVALVAALLPATAAASHNALGELISIGPSGGNAELPAFMRGLSSDGGKVFFETDESLVAEDTDTRQDVYQRQNGFTTLLSLGPNGGNGNFAASYAGSSQDGSKVWIFTSESLVSGDTDTSIDVYEVSSAGVSRVSTGLTGGNGAKNALFDGATPDGSHVFFHTSESLFVGDTDNSIDVYDRSGGLTTWVSAGTPLPAGNGAFAATYKGSSADGSRVFLESSEKLTADDTDNEKDIYERFGATTTRLSQGPTGGNGDPSAGIFYDANFRGASQDGTKVFFDTDETLTGDDFDPTFDVYQRSGGVTTRISTSATAGNDEWDASFRGASADGSKVWFQTNEAMDGADVDAGFSDVYERSGTTTTTLISTGPAAGATSAAADASFVAATATGSRIFITTPAKLVDADTDTGWRDIYERTGTTTNFISTGANDPHGDINAFYGGSSSDGSRVFFFTSDAMLSSDTDGGQDDVYERQAGTTSQLSLGPGTGNDPLSGAAFAGNSSDGLRVFIHTGEQLGAPHDTDTTQDVYAALTNTLYPRPGGATPLRVPLVHAFKQCTSPNSNHISPLSSPSCTPAVLDSNELTTGTVGRSTGSARLDVVPGNVATPADEADVGISASVTDVRKKADGTDYTGQLIFGTGIRITDRANGSSQALSGAAGDTEFSLPITCNPTADTTIGGSCTINTTADTLVPNFAREGKRAIVAIFRLGLEDAGADGDVNPAPPAPFGLSCPPICGSGDEGQFMVQGVFLP